VLLREGKGIGGEGRGGEGLREARGGWKRRNWNDGGGRGE